MGQEEGLRACELPCDSMVPWVTEEMMNLRFEWNQIQESVRTERYNSVMAVYLILSSKKHPKWSAASSW